MESKKIDLLNLTPEQEANLSKNQKKRLKKMREKEAKRNKKLAEMKEKEAKNPKKVKKVEITDPQEYYKNRCTMVNKLKEDKDYFPYPHKWELTHTLPKVIDEFDAKCVEKGKFFDEHVVTLAGRVTSIRSASKKLFFIDITGEQSKIQIFANMAKYGNNEDFEKTMGIIKRGDIIGVTGPIGRTKKGEFSVAPTKIKLLSPCLRMLPQTKTGLTNLETRYRQRYLDLIVNKRPLEIFKIRSKIINKLREILNKRDFMEVETPTLNIIAGGANARPFKTFHNDLGTEMFMRVAPELYLKKCIVGGIDRVYEIGKNFRNEGIDHTHNPEFTACELYWAYADYQDLMIMTEEIICEIVMSIKGSLKFEIKNEEGEVKTVDFTRPWNKVSMLEELEIQLEVAIPEDLDAPETRDFLDKLCVEKNVDCSKPRSTKRLLDKLVDKYIESEIVNPTFLMEQPQQMCPLAKYHRSKPGLTERFELFIDGKEFINAYTELNDPFVQMNLFKGQLQQKEEGDLEANDIDEDFVLSLEHALPPTGGWGLGIDRLCMLLTDSYNIQEVILFPAMKPKVNQVAEIQEKKDTQLEAKTTETTETANTTETPVKTE